MITDIVKYWQIIDQNIANTIEKDQTEDKKNIGYVD